MRLLVFTQKIDKTDSVLGFFHTWVSEMSKKFDSVIVICLGQGETDLPKNVTVYSLGKEKGGGKFGYVIALYRYLFLISDSYDAVFVHMNQEYVLLAGLYWKIKGVPIYMWRNHPLGDFATQIAATLSTKMFCTSTSSFVAQYKKTVIMPVGNDTAFFTPVQDIVRKKHSVIMLGRIAPIKHIELALDAIHHLVSSGAQISLAIVGSPLAKDMDYYESLKKYVANNNLSLYVSFIEEAPFNKHPEIFSSYEINLNLTDSGSFDKTILGGTSCGAIPLVTNTSLKGLLPQVCITEATKEAIAYSIQQLLEPHQQIEIQKELEAFVESQSLKALMEKLSLEIK